jgi:putative DNA primase/helicase
MNNRLPRPNTPARLVEKRTALNPATTARVPNAVAVTATIPILDLASIQEIEVDQPKQKPVPDVLGYLDNDHGNAERLNALSGDTMRYCHAFKKWLIWDGVRWCVDTTDQTRQIAKRCMVEFLRQAVELKKKDQQNFASASLNSHAITNMLRMAQSENVIQPADLDTHPYLLNFLNGTVDLRTGAHHLHCREDFITKVIHHKYRRDAPSPLWRSFLLEVMFGDAELVKFLQRALGYSLTGLTIEKAVFVLFGEGNNGKTTMLATIRELIEEYSVLLQIDSLMMRQKSSNSQADLADLRGARFVQTSESESGQQLAQGNLKRITQGMGSIKAVRKYENPIVFRETHKLWMDTNRKPMITDADDAATFNRLYPIPFTLTIPKERIDRGLPAKLLSEAEGILAWLVEGAMLWHRYGLPKPPAIEAANEKWRADSDWVERFIEDRCAEGGETSGEELFKEYREWAKFNDEKRIASQKEFGMKMAARPGVHKHRTNQGVRYIGLMLRCGA